jgi:2-polyprenyl-3-methyl-5-hydroxy-6-metoxy-1,4-benzoquinol methylase
MTSTPEETFEECWSRSDDPWEHASRFYERRKYAMTLAALPRPRYERAFEPACGIGLLTESLAERAEAVVAVDRHERAVHVTRRRCADRPGVTVGQMTMPDDWPDGQFDLIVCSELLYYFDVPTIDAIVAGFVERLSPGGDLVAVHYRRHVPEHATAGDDVHRRLAACPGLTRSARYADEDFVLEVFRR